MVVHPCLVGVGPHRAPHAPQVSRHPCQSAREGAPHCSQDQDSVKAGGFVGARRDACSC